MSTDQISYKAQAPISPSTILRREELVQALDKAINYRDPNQFTPYKVVVLCAPAGYGKTTLLLDTFQHPSCTWSWYHLDTTDNDVTIFLQRLLISIQHCLPTFGIHLSSLLVDNRQVLQKSSDLTSNQISFINELANALKEEFLAPFALILCNYHEVNQNKAINQLIDRLISCLPQQGVLVIESRAMPALTLAPLIAHRQIFSLGIQALRFSPQEVYELADLLGVAAFSLQDAELLTNSFEGWITGILLCSHLGYPQFHRSIFPSITSYNTLTFMKDQRQLLEYITGDVFKHEIPTYEFLKETSIFTSLRSTYSNELLGITDAKERLAYAEQQGLFVVRNEELTDTSESDGGDSYACHPALRELFMETLRYQAPEHYQTLHERAARLLRTEHRYEQALIHACHAQNYSLAIDIILETAPSIVYEEQDEVLLHWLKMLPDKIIKQQPQLLLIAANIHLRSGEFALVPALLEAVDTLLLNNPLKQDQPDLLPLQAELAIVRAHLLFSQGEFQRVQELCRKALELLPHDERKLHIRAYQYLGASLIVGSGQVQDGIAQLQQALQMSRSQQNESQTATLHRLVANAYSWIDNHALAEYHQTRSLQIWKKLNNVQGLIYSMISMGLLKMRQGATQQARELLTQALDKAHNLYHFTNGEAYALVALGDLYNSTCQYTNAMTYLEDGLKLARHCEDHYLIHCSLCHLAMTYLFMCDVYTAQFFLNQVHLKESEKKSFEGFLFYLTQGTIYLAKQSYEQAERTLEYVADLTKRANIQILYISALLRLAVCYLRQGKQSAALQTGRCIAVLNTKGDFDYFLQFEFQHYCELKPFLDQISSSDQREVSSLATKQEVDEDQPPFITILQGNEDQPKVCSLQVLALGEPKVLYNGMLITRWRMARAMELFFLFLETKRPMRKDQITVALWPDNNSDQCDSTVRTTIYYLRKVLGKNSVTFRSGLYSLNLAAVDEDTIWYDVEIFNEQYSQAKKALEDKNYKAATTAFTQMVSLYHGDYMQSFYNDWCIFRRDKLRQAYMDALHQLALIAYQQKDWENSLQHWQNLLELDSCHEQVHYGIMNCYLQQGRRDLALRQYQRCSQNIQEELHTTPGVSIQELHRRIS